MTNKTLPQALNESIRFQQMKQLGLQTLHSEFKDYWKTSGRLVHGGQHSLGKRKTRRPLDSRRPIHVVMRSSLAKGEYSLRNYAPQIQSTLERFAKKFGVRIYKYSNNSNHLHLLIKFNHRKDLRAFLRTTTGLIARTVLNAKKGRPSGKVTVGKSRFWDHLVFTRVAHWGQAYENLQSYVVQNILEAAGVVPYKPRGRRRVRMADGPSP